MLTGVDTEITRRAAFDLCAMAKYASQKQSEGDPECYEKYMLLLDRVSNLVYALDSPEIEDALTDSEHYCLYHRLFELLQTNSHIPGFINPNINTTLTGISHMAIRYGYGNIFTIS